MQFESAEKDFESLRLQEDLSTAWISLIAGVHCNAVDLYLNPVPSTDTVNACPFVSRAVNIPSSASIE
jgi:hypothetical protein